MRNITIVVIIMAFTLICILIGCIVGLHRAFAFDCVKTKYETVIDRYGIMTSSVENRDYFLQGKRTVELGSCFDNNVQVNLFRTPADEEQSLKNQTYLNGDVEKELSDEEKAIIFLESLGYIINK